MAVLISNLLGHMKKNFLSIGLLCASAFVLTNCNNQIAEPQVPVKEGMPFELTATPQGTKTENDGMKTKWVTDDALNVFHAEAGTTVYGTNDKFTYSASNTFSGTLTKALAADKSYDWYALYPYNTNISTPKNTGSKGYVTVGGAIQTQKGNNDKGHLAGNACPMYGIATGVAASTTPNISMNHLTSVVKIHLTNNSGEAMTVNTISFTAPETIVGTYFIDFVSSPIVYTESNASYVSKTATLNVINGESIANGASADFYIAVKPFIATNGQELVITVNGKEKKKTLSSDVEFKAGSIKTVNFNFNEPAVKIANGDYLIMVKDGANYYAMSADNSTGSANRRGFVTISDYTKGSTYSTVYDNIIWKFEQSGAGVTISNKSKYLTPAKNNATLSSSPTEIRYVGAADGTFQLSYYLGETDGTRYLSKNDANGFAFYASETGLHDLIIAPANLDTTTPVIVISDTNLNVEKDASTGEISYSIINPSGKTISAVSDQSWISGFDFSVEGKVKFDIAANSGAERTANVTLSYEGAADVVVTVKQESGLVNKYTWTATSGALGDTASETKTLNGIDWTITRDALYTGYTSYCIQMGKKDNAENVVLSTNGISGIISKVDVECSSKSGIHTLDITVGGTSYVSGKQTASWSTVSTISGTGSSSGEIVLSFNKGASTGALYIKSITIEYK